MEHKKYWIKLEKDFLNSSQIKVIKNMTNGKDYIIFYLALMLESTNSEGHLRFSELVPYNEEMLASVTDTNVDIVRSAMKIFESLGMIQILSNGTIFLPDVPKRLGKESESAERVRAYRERQKQLSCNNVTNCNDNKEEEENKNKYQYKDIVEYLNEKAGTNYRYTSKATQTKIKARIDEHFTLDDFKKVIDKKVEEWKGTEMEQYLRPETLFGTKFEGYLNAKINPKKQNKTQARMAEKRDYTKAELNSLFTNLEEVEIN